MSNSQNNDLWVKRLSPVTDIGQGQNFNKYEYLKNLGTNENIEQAYIQDRSGNNAKLRKEIEFSERGMQRVRMRFDRIPKDPLLTLTTSLASIKLKQLIGLEYHDYLE